MRIVRRCLVVWVLLAVAAPAAEAPRGDAGHDGIFRPTVLIRKGRAQGSGTVIASRRGETLVLTAAHVVEDPGPLVVELHRYNLGVERATGSEGWPRPVSARMVAADVAADVAVLRLSGLGPLPYVARLAAEAREPAPGTVVTSVGIDRGTLLGGWNTRIAEVDRFEIEGTGAERLFLVTERPPEHGRSGGGLFLRGGELVGVCVGKAEFVQGKRSGVYASGASIRRLLRAHALDDRVGQAPEPRRRTPVTATRSRSPR